MGDGGRICTHVTPLAEVFGGIPLELLVSLVADYGGSAPGQPPLGDIYMMALHPLGPVAPVTAVDKAGTFEEKGGTGHHRRFLKRTRTKRVTPDVGAMDFPRLKTNAPGPEQQQGWKHREWFLARSSSGGTGSASFPDEWLPNSPRSCSSWLPDWLRDAPGNCEVLIEKAKWGRRQEKTV